MLDPSDSYHLNRFIERVLIAGLICAVVVAAIATGYVIGRLV